jgi:cell filamentation protein
VSGAPHTHPNGTLVNKLGITDPDKLAAIEADLSGLVYAAIISGETLDIVEDRNGIHRLCQIHESLFGDIYPFAGQLRTVALTKSNYADNRDGATIFALPQSIQSELNALFTNLDRQHAFMAQSRRAFVENAATFLARLNGIHPFREGNGRTQRAYLSLLAREAGHTLSFMGITSERMVASSIAAAGNDLEPMREMIDELTDPVRFKILVEAHDFIAANRPDSATRQVATTIAGRNYAGKYITANDRTFIFYDDAGSFLVGNVCDLPGQPGHEERIDFTATRTVDQEAQRWIDGIEYQANPGQSALRLQEQVRKLEPHHSCRAAIHTAAPERIAAARLRDAIYNTCVRAPTPRNAGANDGSSSSSSNRDDG